MKKQINLDKVLEAAGGGVCLARELGITHQAVYQWNLIPVKHVLKVEEITGISRQRLRPDIYPDE